MASAYYGANRGTSLGLIPKDLTTSASASGSTDIEIRIDLTKNWTRREIAEFLHIAADKFACPELGGDLPEIYGADL